MDRVSLALTTHSARFTVEAEWPRNSDDPREEKGGITELHFNDLRGTAATKFYTSGLSIRVIAEVLAWEEDSVERIIRRYVGRSAATKVMIAQLNKAER